MKVMRIGRTTLPAEYRARLGMNEGDELIVEAVGNQLVLRRVPNLLDLAGVDAKYGTREQAKRSIEKMREEYQRRGSYRFTISA